ANGDEALRESLADLEEGADLLMVKPAGPYLDVIARLADRTLAPIAAYQVGGEYAMLRHAAQAGAFDEREAVLESLVAIRRAGAGVLTVGRATAARGTSFGAPTVLEIELAEAVKDCMPSIELVRFVSSGTEAAMSAVRLARGFTGRDKVLKFAGCYHGHSDLL